jgi:hypothetical protein
LNALTAFFGDAGEDIEKRGTVKQLRKGRSMRRVRRHVSYPSLGSFGTVLRREWSVKLLYALNLDMWGIFFSSKLLLF